MIDFRGETDEYPLDERKKKETFPPINRLLVYGEDVPLPETFDELRCTYTNNERTPPLELHELEGFCVPPLGLTHVLSNGAGKCGRYYVYKPGTFRADRHSSGLELGLTGRELAIAKHKKHKEAIEDAIAETFEEKGLDIFNSLYDKDSAVIAAMFKWAMKMIDESDNAREAINFIKLTLSRLDHQVDALDNLKEKPALSVEDALKLIDKTAELMENKVEFIEGKVEDIDS